MLRPRTASSPSGRRARSRRGPRNSRASPRAASATPTSGRRPRKTATCTSWAPRRPARAGRLPLGNKGRVRSSRATATSTRTGATARRRAVQPAAPDGGVPRGSSVFRILITAAREPRRRRARLDRALRQQPLVHGTLAIGRSTAPRPWTAFPPRRTTSRRPRRRRPPPARPAAPRAARLPRCATAACWGAPAERRGRVRAAVPAGSTGRASVRGPAHEQAKKAPPPPGAPGPDGRARRRGDVRFEAMARKVGTRPLCCHSPGIGQQDCDVECVLCLPRTRAPRRHVPRPALVTRGSPGPP